MNSAMTLRDVSAFYDGKPAIAHISADIPRNEITAVIGPSGCGKSTLLRCMNGLLAQEPGTEVRGEIALDGTDICRARSCAAAWGSSSRRRRRFRFPSSKT